ncbi:MAG: IS66 family transposase [Mariprofundales bacterium]
MILYHYAPTRAGDVAAEFLGDKYRGYLQTDGYAGYHALCARDGVVGIACLAHIRRKFVDAAKPHKGKQTLGHEEVAMIKRLYAIESYAKKQKMTAKQRHALRLEKSKPILDYFKQWMDQHQSEVPPKLPLGKAFTYAQNEWERMMHYLDDGRIDIDNNAAERSIKPFVIGLKNWLFCNSANSAQSSAVIYSLLQSASANDLPLLEWLTFTLKDLPRCTTDDQRRALLPHHFDVARLKK